MTSPISSFQTLPPSKQKVIRVCEVFSHFLDAFALAEFIFDYGSLSSIPPSLQMGPGYILQRKRPLSGIPPIARSVKIQGQYSLPDDVHSVVFSGLQFGYLEELSFGYSCCRELHTVTFSSMVVLLCVDWMSVLTSRFALFERNNNT